MPEGQGQTAPSSHGIILSCVKFYFDFATNTGHPVAIGARSRMEHLMKHPNIPPIQGRRFDIETLQDKAFSLTRQADKGPTWLRHGGRIAYVVLTEEMFDQVWPDPRRAWSVEEMPDRHWDMIQAALSQVTSESPDAE